MRVLRGIAMLGDMGSVDVITLQSIYLVIVDMESNGKITPTNVRLQRFCTLTFTWDI